MVGCDQLMISFLVYMHNTATNHNFFGVYTLLCFFDLLIAILATHCDIHEELWTFQVVVEMEVAVPFDTAVRELHAELCAIRKTRDGETKWFGEMVTSRLQEGNRLTAPYV